MYIQIKQLLNSCYPSLVKGEASFRIHYVLRTYSCGLHLHAFGFLEQEKSHVNSVCEFVKSDISELDSTLHIYTITHFFNSIPFVFIRHMYENSN